MLDVAALVYILTLIILKQKLSKAQLLNYIWKSAVTIVLERFQHD